MSESEKTQSTPTGTTIPDLLLHIIRSPYLVAPLLLLIAAVIVCVAMGLIDISWGDGGSGIKVTQGHKSAPGTEVNVAGDWDGSGKDLSDSEKKIIARYSYKMKFKFTPSRRPSENDRVLFYRRSSRSTRSTVFWPRRRPW